MLLIYEGILTPTLIGENHALHLLDISMPSAPTIHSRTCFYGYRCLVRAGKPHSHLFGIHIVRFVGRRGRSDHDDQLGLALLYGDS